MRIPSPSVAAGPVPRQLLQAAQALLALLGLLGGLAVQATKLSPLPLQTSVLAKPNVIFALDDSGSMDAEVMIDGNFQGWFYGNYGSNELYPGGRPRDGNARWDWNMFYLFPNGTGAGNRVYSEPDASYGYAIPPTPQMAWLRSPAYNSIYYDTTKTYKPWPAAYLDGATQTYANASAGAARSHPALGSTTIALNANLTNTDTNWRFTFTGGMVIPHGATDVACLDGSSPGIPAGGLTVDTSRGMCKASVTFYPATFWHREDCTVNGSTCVAAWDGRTLKRYEIKSGNSFPSGRSHADELQNFANWFTYWRKRRMLLAGAMGSVLENVTGLRLGVMNFNTPRGTPDMVDADIGSGAGSRMAVAGRFYAAEGSGGTPTHGTMAAVYNEFDTNTGVVQYACQRNVQFIITDGFANDFSVSPPAYSQATWGGTRPYQTTEAASLADKALAYYTLRLRDDGDASLPAGQVPRSRGNTPNPDNNTDLHVQTYALTLGMKGTVWPSATSPFTSPPTWPSPVRNAPSMIDDLWHATINGRGEMYLATDAAGAAASIAAGLTDILDQQGSQAGVAVTSINLERGDSKAYLGTYNPAGWGGDLTANAVNQATGAVSDTALWSADARLQARSWTTRVIATHVGSAGAAFTAANVGSAVNPGNAYGTHAAVVDYLRGNRSGEGTSFRTRAGLIGAVINAEPVASRDDKLIYLASSEGMVHAIDTDTGDEHWAFVPPQALADLGRTSQRGWAFATRLDATPALGKLPSSGRKLLVGGLGAGGRGWWALDVSNPRGMSEAALAGAALWRFPATSDATNLARMGYNTGRALIVRTAASGDVVLVTSGYDNGETIGDGKGRVWMLNATTGAVITTFTTTEGTAGGAEAGLAHLSAWRESDGTVRHVYGGDLLGNLWHFDLSNGSTTLLATLQDGAGNRQPVTAAPELVQMAGKRVVLIGTGRLLDMSDGGGSRRQSFYAIADGSTLTNARSGLVARTYTRGANPEVSGATIDWSTQRGWYVDLPAGEHANTLPTVAYGAVGFVTNKLGGSDCSQSSYLYLIDIGTGLKPALADMASAQISSVSMASRLTTLRLADGRLVGTSHTSNNGIYSRQLSSMVPIQPRKNAWKEIRR